MDHIKKYYSHKLFEADIVADTGAPAPAGAGKTGLVNANTGPDVKAKTPGTPRKPAATEVSKDTLDGGEETNAKTPSATEIFIAYFYNNMKQFGPKLDIAINDAIKEAESENGIKGARGFAGIAGAEWIVLRRSIFYASMMYIFLRFVNKTGAEGMKAAVTSKAAAKIASGKKSKEQRDKEKDLKEKAKQNTNEDIAYIEGLAEIGGLFRALVQRTPTAGINKQGTFRYFIKDVATMYGILLGTKSGIRYCKSPIGSGRNHVERFYDAANLNQTYAVTLKYINNIARGKPPNEKWAALSPDILQKTLAGSAFQLNYSELAKVTSEMAKQMFLLAYENEDVKINKANEKVQNALSKFTGIQPQGNVSKKISQDTLK